MIHMRTIALPAFFAICLAVCRVYGADVTATPKAESGVTLTPYWVDNPESLEKAVTSACAEAKRDFQKSEPKFIICGLPGKETDEVAAFLQEKHGVVAVRLGCVVSESDVMHAEIYNRMIRYLFRSERQIDLEAEIKARFPSKKPPNQALQHNDPSCHVPCLRTNRASRGRG